MSDTDTTSPTEIALSSKSRYLDTVSLDDSMEPNTLGGMMRLAEILSTAKLIPDHFKGDPGSTLLVMMASKQLGLPVVAGLQNAYVVGGKVGWQAVVLETLAKRSGRCRKFFLSALNEQQATFTVQTAEMDAPTTVTYTLEDARKAGLLSREGGGWMKNPKDMLVARCRARAARQFFPDAILGMYSVEELRDGTVIDVDPLPPPSTTSTAARPAGDDLLSRLSKRAEALPDPTPEPEPEPAEEPAEPAPEPFTREAAAKVAKFTLEIATKTIGKSGPALVENFVQNRFNKPLAELTEDEFEQVDEFIAKAARKRTP